MLKSQLPKSEINEEDTEEEKIKPTPLPDLFTMMNDDDEFGSDETEMEVPKSSAGESFIPAQDKAPEKISDSQRLENSSDQILEQILGNQTNKIKRIVLFYENGKFESFEP
jgi:hypothetical protein